jgi:predicted tellurium resistance membrane protein TerC
MNGVLDLLVAPEAWAALVTLTVLEIVLGIDNLIFISVLTNKLPEDYRDRARQIGISMALILRLVLLAGISVIIGLTSPAFSLFDHAFTWRDLILISGGLFLVWKSTSEIHQKVDGTDEEEGSPDKPAAGGFAAAIVQIVILDMVFSIDSIITAVGMTNDLPIMYAAVIIAVGLMFWTAGPLSDFIRRNPTVVMLALSFLLMIGTALIAEGWGASVKKGYIYTAMAFSAVVEGLNILSRKRSEQRRKGRG